MQVVLTVNVPQALANQPQALIADRMQKAADKAVFWNSNLPTPYTQVDAQGNTMWSWVVTAT
jgi:hypothetical protein